MLLMNMARLLELALRFPATRRVTYQAATSGTNLIIKKYNDTLDDIAWGLARDHYMKNQSKENNE
jgi:hypothetical protein